MDVDASREIETVQLSSLVSGREIQAVRGCAGRAARCWRMGGVGNEGDMGIQPVQAETYGLSEVSGVCDKGRFGWGGAGCG